MTAAQTEGRAWWGPGGLVRRRAAPQMGWVLLAIGVGFLVLWPVLQLQWRAFLDGGSAFARMMELPRIGATIQTTIVLAILSSVLAVVIGTLLVMVHMQVLHLNACSAVCYCHIERVVHLDKMAHSV